MALDEEEPSRSGDDFPTDALVEILRRLPPNSRCRSRLVCRQWRDAVDERTTTDLRSHAKTLLAGQSYAGVLDAKLGLKLKLAMENPEGQAMEVVGTCNGLVCLCDGGGAISLANPANGETLALPPLPCAGNGNVRHGPPKSRYGFAHHQGTGQYKVVRIPCCSDREFHKLQVFALGETSWRDVVTPAAVGGAGERCLRRAGIVGVDGAVYWVADGTERIMSFDLAEERVTAVKPPPVPPRSRPPGKFRLAEVHGRLGAAILHDPTAELGEKTDVWVLESARGEQRWRRRYSVETSVQPPQQLMLPHFAHGGKRVLTREDFAYGKQVLYSNQPRRKQKMSGCGMVQISDRESNAGRVALRCQVDQAFAYVETKEPLNVYKLW